MFHEIFRWRVFTCCITVLALLPFSVLAGETLPEGGRPVPSAQERAIAFGLLLDTPTSQAAIDEGLIVAEQLRRIFGIDTGKPFADYRAAAERAREEVLEPLDPSPEELAAVATALGYSLAPESCGNNCNNVERLARAEFAKRALKAFIAAADSTGPAVSHPSHP